MAVIATDDFSGTLSNWDATSWAGNTCSISSGQLAASTASNDCGVRWTADTFDDDQWAEADFTMATNGEAYVGVRTSLSAETGYFAVWNYASSGSYAIDEATAGSYVALGATATGKGTTGTRTIRMEAVGTALTMYVDGVEEIARTDATITSGTASLVMYGSTATRFDNFSAGDWRPGPENVLATDDFNRADGTLGSNWTTPSGGAVDPVIVSNVVTASTTATDYNSMWTADTVDNDQWVEADLTLGTIGTTSEASVNLRGAAASWNGYYASWDNTSSGRYRIIKAAGGSFSNVLTSSTGHGTTGTRTVRLEVVGTVLTMYVDDVEVLSHDDSTSPYTSGAPGFQLYRNGGSGLTLDNFSAGDWIDPGVVVDTKIQDYRETSSFTTTTSPKTITGASWLSGDVILVGYVSDNGGMASAAPTNANLTFTKINGVSGGSNVSGAAMWAATAATQQWNQTISCSTTDGFATWGASLWVVRGQNLRAVGVCADRTSGGSHNVTVSDGASVFGLFPDWDEANANDTPKTGSGTATERRDSNGGGYDQYVVDWESTTAGTYAFGYSATTGDTNLLIMVESQNVIATDDFNRANEQLDASANWDIDGWANLDVSSNVVVADAGSQYSYGLWVGDTLDNDQWAEADISALDGTGGEAGVLVRGTVTGGTNSTTAYALMLSDGGQVWLYEYTGGSRASLASTASGYFDDTVAHTARIEVVGTTITGYVDGVEAVTQTDATITSGAAGIGIMLWSPGVSIDNFSAGDWVATAPSTVIDYLIEYRTTSGPGAWQSFSDGVSATTGATVTGLTPGVSYDFRVSAVNSSGAGAWSNIATVVASSSGTIYLKLGDNSVSAMKLGDTSVGAAYLGDTQIL